MDSHVYSIASPSDRNRSPPKEGPGSSSETMTRSSAKRMDALVLSRGHPTPPRWRTQDPVPTVGAAGRRHLATDQRRWPVWGAPLIHPTWSCGAFRLRGRILHRAARVRNFGSVNKLPRALVKRLSYPHRSLVLLPYHTFCACRRPCCRGCRRAAQGWSARFAGLPSPQRKSISCGIIGGLH